MNIKTITDRILGDVPALYRSDREIDVLRIARARALLAAAPPGSKLAQVYAAQVNVIASGYAKGSI